MFTEQLTFFNSIKHVGTTRGLHSNDCSDGGHSFRQRTFEQCHALDTFQFYYSNTTEATSRTAESPSIPEIV